jgi:hypothetical protein
MADVEKNIEYLEKQLAYFLYIIGLDPLKIDTLSIDEILQSARLFTQNKVSSSSSLGYTESYSKLDSGSPESIYINYQKLYLITNIRRFWYWLSIAKGLG